MTGRRLHVGEDAPQLVQLERLLEEGTSEALEELQRVAAHRIARGEHHPVRDGGVHLRQGLVHLAPAQPRHAQVADDQVEGLRERPLQRLAAVGCEYHDVPPALERRLHVMEDVRLVVDDQHAQGLPCGTRCRRGLAFHQLRRGRQTTGGGARQLDGERGARTGPRIHRHAAPVLLHDPLADREAQARALALRLRAEKRLEHMLRDGLGHARPVVRDAHRDTIEPALGGHRDAAVLGVRATDGLRGVVDDVHEYLLDLVRVHFDLGEPRLRGERELDVLRHQLVLEQLDRRFEDRPDGLELALAFLASGEREQVAHDARCALRLLPDDGEGLLEPFRHVLGFAQQVREPHD